MTINRRLFLLLSCTTTLGIIARSQIAVLSATEFANIAINVDSSKNCQIESLIIEQFSGIAILCAGSSDSNRCTNISIDKIKIGNWYDAYEGSFPQIWFFKFVYNSIVKNAQLEGGNFVIGFYDAYFGTKIDSSSKDIPNSGVYGCSVINNTIENQSR
jgi:hypothetical protein